LFEFGAETMGVTKAADSDEVNRAVEELFQGVREVRVAHDHAVVVVAEVDEEVDVGSGGVPATGDVRP
jgi:hypothetical protein